MLRFYSNYIRLDEGIGYPCFYGQDSKCFENDNGQLAITVFAKSFEPFPIEIRDKFTVRNASVEGHREKDKFTVQPDHEYYPHVKFAYDLQRELMERKNVA